MTNHDQRSAEQDWREPSGDAGADGSDRSTATRRSETASDEYRRIVRRAKRELSNVSSPEDARKRRHRERIAVEMARLPDAPPEPDYDYLACADAMDVRHAEAEWRRRGEIAGEDDDMRTGVADMYGFVRSIEAGFVPDATVLRSLAKRLEDVLTKTTNLLDQIPRDADRRRQDVTRQFDSTAFEYVDRVRPRTDNTATGRAFLDHFDMRRPGKESDPKTELWGRGRDWRYRAIEHREPGIKQEVAFARLAMQDRDRKVVELAREETEAMLSEPPYVKLIAGVAVHSQTNAAAYHALHWLSQGKAVAIDSEDERWRLGLEAAHEAWRRAEASVPELSDADAIKAGRADITRWGRWLARQTRPTVAERHVPSSVPSPREPSGKAGTEGRDSEKGAK